MVSPPAAAELARNQVSASCRPSSLTVELDEEPLPVRSSCLDIEGRIRVAQTPLARATQPVGGAGCPCTQDFPAPHVVAGLAPAEMPRLAAHAVREVGTTGQRHFAVSGQ
jgi:hypothetical protein